MLNLGLLLSALRLTTPALLLGKTSDSKQMFDIQAHRGGRGNTIENTIPSFAWGMIHGATTMEMDNGITKDGAVIVWHDENIVATKCLDTKPATPNDPDFPYVGKYVANLTLAQIKTLDCGSQREPNYPLQLLYPGTRISTLTEVFAFADCADPDHIIRWNIESKVDAQYPNLTRAPEDFVAAQLAVFKASNYLDKITYQSFDWRTLPAMKKLEPSIPTAALIDDDSGNLHDPTNAPSKWLAGINLNSFPGQTVDVRIAQAAHALGADILSTSAAYSTTPVSDPTQPGYLLFTTKAMVDEAHRLNLQVLPWTVDRLNVADQLYEWGVDGLITDYPDSTRRWAQQKNIPITPKLPRERVLACLEKFNQVSS